MNSHQSRTLGWIFLYALLVVATYAMLRPFWEALAWSFILAAVSWPLYKRLHGVLKQRDTLAAVVMSLGVIAIVVVPMALIFSSLFAELGPAYAILKNLLVSPPAPPDWLSRVPAAQQAWLDAAQALRHGSVLGKDLLLPLLRPGTQALALVGANMGQAGLAFFTLFFLYRNGDRYFSQAKAVLSHLLGERAERLLNPTKEAMRAVFAGVILAAVAQGIAAGLGFALVGLRAPILLGVATSLLALIPFGAVLIWGTAAAGLFFAGATVKALILVAWGVVIVSSVDNLVRPLVISGTSRLPYLQTFFFILGGLAVFGLVGLFIGPAVLAVWMVLWDEWVEAGKREA
ncbi:MAG TPA: AI-2E family transporter [Pantanalinema sp.]